MGAIKLFVVDNNPEPKYDGGKLVMETGSFLVSHNDPYAITKHPMTIRAMAVLFAGSVANTDRPAAAKVTAAKVTLDDGTFIYTLPDRGYYTNCTKQYATAVKLETQYG